MIGSKFSSKNILAFKLIVYLIVTAFEIQAAPLLSQPHAYYGKDFYDQINQGQLRDEDLVELLNEILTSVHVSKPDDFDEISRSCPSRSNCYRQGSYSYTQVRYFLFGQLDLEVNGKGDYQIRSFYCQEELDSSRFAKGRGPAPGQIPDSNLLNVEHAWPQSKFSRRESRNTQKTDLHILFPVLSYVNSIRGNHPFGEVDDPISSPCPGVKIGRIKSNQSNLYFEPPTNQKGNIARSLFYFSIRYKSRIDATQESFFRQWNQIDPPNEEERSRNDRIFDFEKVRNPFVDHPELVDLISDF